jgi:glutamyl/glutaminyl-tRNA synthetase
LAPDRSKLSGRHGAVSVRDYKSKGYLAEALVNYLALLGWHPEGEQELFSLAELINQFKLERVQKGGATFDVEKLNWLNREYLKRLTDEEFASRAAEFWPEAPAGLLVKLAPELKARLTTLEEISTMATSGDFGFYTTKPAPDRDLLKTTEFLPEIIARLEAIDENNFTAENLKSALWDFATDKGRGNVLWPMRAALTGRKQSPDPFFVAAVLGKAESLARLNHAATV